MDVCHNHSACVMESTSFTTSVLSSVKDSTNSFWDASDNLSGIWRWKPCFCIESFTLWCQKSYWFQELLGYSLTFGFTESGNGRPVEALPHLCEKCWPGSGIDRLPKLGCCSTKRSAKCAENHSKWSWKTVSAINPVVLQKHMPKAKDSPVKNTPNCKGLGLQSLGTFLILQFCHELLASLNANFSVQISMSSA